MPTEPVCTEAPDLATLRSRPCTLEELQAALVKLIELHNSHAIKISSELDQKQPKEWRATI